MFYEIKDVLSQIELKDINKDKFTVGCIRNLY